MAKRFKRGGGSMVVRGWRAPTAPPAPTPNEVNTKMGFSFLWDQVLPGRELEPWNEMFESIFTDEYLGTVRYDLGTAQILDEDIGFERVIQLFENLPAGTEGIVTLYSTDLNNMIRTSEEHATLKSIIQGIGPNTPVDSAPPGSCPSDLNAYKAIVAELVGHLEPLGLRYLQIENEIWGAQVYEGSGLDRPLNRWWYGTLAEYVTECLAANTAISNAGSDVIVIPAGIAYGTPWGGSVPANFATFIQYYNSILGGSMIDGHCYGSPDDDQDKYDKTRAVLNAYGLSEVPIICTETGMGDIDLPPYDTYAGTLYTENELAAQAVDYPLRLQTLLQIGFERALGFSIYRPDDFREGENSKWTHMRLAKSVDDDYEELPAFDAIRTMVRAMVP